MRDEFAIEEMHIRAELEKMDAAFCAAMLRAIDAGDERAGSRRSSANQH